MKTIVVVSRHWNRPDITAFVSETVVGAQMSLPQFIESLVEQTGNPAMVMTKAQLAAKLKAAADVVIDEMKKSTAKVV